MGKGEWFFKSGLAVCIESNYDFGTGEAGKRDFSMVLMNSRSIDFAIIVLLKNSNPTRLKIIKKLRDAKATAYKDKRGKR